MKAIRVGELGGPEVLRLQETSAPRPGPGEVLVGLRAIGVNFIDTYHRQGLYPLALPFTPGVEGAGIITEVGSGVTRFVPGDRVSYVMSVGSYAEQAVVAESKAVRLPEAVAFDTGTAAMVQGLTAHYLLFDTYPVKADHTLLVHAGAGGVGLLLLQIARKIGARTIATVSSEEKAELARQAGAGEVILYSRQDFEPLVRSLTGDRGVDVVYDSVGLDTFDRSMKCLRPRGYLVLFGQSSGPVPPVDPQVLNSRGSLFLTRPSLAHYISGPEELDRRASDLFGWIEKGDLKLRIGQIYRLDEAAQAHRDLEGRRTTGKVLLIP
jgi:NADPH:quinone reductase